jgi:hypothetical protein
MEGWPGLDERLAPYGRRLRLRDGVEVGQRTLWFAGVAAVLVQVAGRVVPIKGLGWWTIAPVVGWTMIVAGAALLRRQSTLHVARHLDRELGLKERIATAVFLEGAVHAKEGGRGEGLVALQRQDALAALASGRTFAIRWARVPLIVAGALAGAAIALALVPNPMRGLLGEREAFAGVAQQEAAAIERLRDEIAEQPALIEQEREELLRRLTELAAELRANQGSEEEALADLSRAEQELAEQVDPDAAAKQSVLMSLSTQLQALSKEATGQDAAAAEDALRALAEAMADADVGQQAEMTKALAQMAAQAAQAGNDALAQAMARMAQAAEAGQAGEADKAAQAAAAAMAEARQAMAGQQALRRALEQIGESRRAMSRAGDAESTPGHGEGEGQGQGQELGQGEGQGKGGGERQGQGQGQGQSAGGGGGTRADTLPPARRTGQAGRPQGAGDSGQSGEIGGQVYVPWERRKGGDAEMRLLGQDTGQGETEVREWADPLPGSSRAALVPYQEVYQTYLDAANQAIEQSYIPPALREYVRAYFTELEP